MLGITTGAHRALQIRMREQPAEGVGAVALDPEGSEKDSSTVTGGLPLARTGAAPSHQEPA